MSRLTLAGVLLLVAAGLLRAVAPAGAASATLSVSPATQTVNPGASFSIAVVQNADVVTIGAQTNLTFDPSLLQVVSVDKGAAYAGAPLLMGVSPQTPAEAIADANANGTLKNVAAFYAPGAGSVPAGATDFVVVQMQAKQFGGASPVTLAAAELLDTSGGTVPLTLNAGEVSVTGATAPPTPTPDPNATATPTPVATPTPTPGTPFPTPPPPRCNIDSPPEAQLSAVPASLAGPPGSKFPVSIVLTTSETTTGAGADFTFDPKLLQILAVEKGSAYTRAALIMGEILPNGEDRTGPRAIEDANRTGLLNDVSTYFIPGTGSVKPGENEAIRISFQAQSAEGTSPIRLSGGCVLNEAGFDLITGVQHGEVKIDVNAPPPVTPTPLGAVRAPSPAAARLPSAGGADGVSELKWASTILMTLGVTCIAGGLVIWRIRRSEQRG